MHERANPNPACCTAPTPTHPCRDGSQTQGASAHKEVRSPQGAQCRATLSTLCRVRVHLGTLTCRGWVQVLKPVQRAQPATSDDDEDFAVPELRNRGGGGGGGGGVSAKSSSAQANGGGGISNGDRREAKTKGSGRTADLIVLD